VNTVRQQFLTEIFCLLEKQHVQQFLEAFLPGRWDGRSGAPIKSFPEFMIAAKGRQVDRAKSCLLLYEIILAAVSLLCVGAPVEGALESWA